MKRRVQKVERPASLIKQYKIFVFDMDGVFWRGEHNLLPSVDYLNALQKAQKIVYFLTNNSTQTRSHYVAKLSALGYSTTEEHVHTSASLVAAELQRRRVQRVFVLGQEGLRREIQDCGIETTWLQDGVLSRHCQGREDQQPVGESVRPDLQGTVVGSDLTVQFPSITYGLQVARHNPDAFFALTNPDTYANVALTPGEEKFVPGAGCLGALFQCFLEKNPDISPGKPDPTFLSALLLSLQLLPSECLFIGDNLSTDIQLALNAGTDSLCVLSGVTSESKVLDEQTRVPTYYASHLFI